MIHLRRPRNAACGTLLALAAVGAMTSGGGRPPGDARAQAPTPPAPYGLEAIWEPAVVDGILDPADIAAGPDGRWYVVDRAAGHVAVIDASGQVVATIGRRGDGAAELYRPTALAIDAARGRVYVGDSGHERIQVYGLGGAHIATWAVQRRSFGYRPSRMAVLASGDVVFFNDWYSGESGGNLLVERIDPNGVWLDGWYAGEIDFPDGIEADWPPTAGLAGLPDGTIGMATRDGVLVRVTVDGDVVGAFRTPVPTAAGLSTSPAGDVLVLCPNPPGVGRFSPGGRYAWFPASNLPAADRYTDPRAVALAADGRFAVVGGGENGGGRGVTQLTAAGALVARSRFDPRAAVGFIAPVALAAGPGGLYALESDPAGRVAVIGRDGRAAAGIPVPEHARDLGVLGDGSLIVAGRPESPYEEADETVHRFLIDRIAPGGALGWRTHLTDTFDTYNFGNALRITAGAGRIYASQVASGAAALEPLSGTLTAGPVQTTGIAGATELMLQPTDIAADGAGRAYVANPMAATLEVWSPGLAPWPSRLVWALGRGAVPYRVAAGGPPDAAVVAVLRLDGDVDVYDADGGRIDHWRLPPPPGARRADGRDIAVGPDGAVYVLDGARDRVLVYARGAGGAGPRVPPAPTPDPAPPPPGRCRLVGDKVAGPRTVRLDARATVTLTLRSDCPPAQAREVDVALVIDRSGSMDGWPLMAAKAAANAFVRALDLDRQQVAVVSFASDVRLDRPLTWHDFLARAAIDGLEAGSATNIAGAIETAAAHLRDAGRPDAAHVIVLLTDGQPTCCGDEPQPSFDTLRQAALARADGIELYAIQLREAVNANLLRALVSADDLYVKAPSPADLDAIYRRIAVDVQAVAATDVAIDDRLFDRVAYADDSAVPPAARRGDVLAWRRPSISAQGITLTYQVRPLAVGTYPTNAWANATYTDVDGVRRVYAFPRPEITVLPALAKAYLPLVQRSGCLLADRPDVMMVLDASVSTGGARVGTMENVFSTVVSGVGGLPNARLGMVTFDREARVAAPLDDMDWGTLWRALWAIRSRPGTRIDLGLAAATAELAANRRPRQYPIIVLVSDGQQYDQPQAAIDTAAAARAAGARIVVVGIGPAVNDALLATLAGRPDDYLGLGGQWLDRDWEKLWEFIDGAVRPPCVGW